MVHAPYFMQNPDSNTAVLFLHGIVGSPNHFKDFLPIAEAKCSVYNILLEGHGGTVEAFAHSSMEKWKAQVDRTVSELLDHHKHLILVAHSMGTLFAMEQALLHPREISFLFLLAPPLKVVIRPKACTTALKLFFGKIDDPLTLAKSQGYSLELDRRLWKYFGCVPRYRELGREIKTVQKLVSQVPVPSYAYLSREDELVSLSTRKYLEQNPKMEIHILPHSTHDFYGPKDKQQLLSDFEALLKGL